MDLAQLHRDFGRFPHAAPAPARVEIPWTTIADQAASYRPGYIEAILAACTPLAPGLIAIDSSTLHQMRQQFRPGCCGQ